MRSKGINGRQCGTSTARGFEPLRAEPNGFRVHHLSHSVILSITNANNMGIYQGKNHVAILTNKHEGHRQQGDSNPCWQSQMNFPSITEAARSCWLLRMQITSTLAIAKHTKISMDNNSRHRHRPSGWANCHTYSISSLLFSCRRARRLADTSVCTRATGWFSVLTERTYQGNKRSGQHELPHSVCLCLCHLCL